MKTQDYSTSVGSTSTVILDKNPARLCAYFVNDSDEGIYLQFDVAASLNHGIYLSPNGGSFEISMYNPFNGQINAICTSGGKNLCVLEVSVT